MAQRTVYLSDLSGQDIPDGEQVELRIIEYPDLNQRVKLDASSTEINRLKLEATALVLLEVVDQDGNAERLAIDVETFNKSVRGDVEEVLANAEELRAPEPQSRAFEPPRQRRARGTAPVVEKTDYTAPENFGVIHRGKITDAEAALVRENPEQADANRARAGQPAIDPKDAKEKARYGFE